MKYLASLLPFLIVIPSLLLSACDTPPSPTPQADTPFSEQGLPSSQRQQEDNAAGVKFGDKQTFQPLTPSSAESP